MKAHLTNIKWKEIDTKSKVPVPVSRRSIEFVLFCFVDSCGW